jgi:hypothetical protein
MMVVVVTVVVAVVVMVVVVMVVVVMVAVVMVVVLVVVLVAVVAAAAVENDHQRTAASGTPAWRHLSRSARCRRRSAENAVVTSLTASASKAARRPLRRISFIASSSTISYDSTGLRARAA